MQVCMIMYHSSCPIEVCRDVFWLQAGAVAKHLGFAFKQSLDMPNSNLEPDRVCQHKKGHCAAESGDFNWLAPFCLKAH